MSRYPDTINLLLPDEVVVKLLDSLEAFAGAKVTRRDPAPPPTPACHTLLDIRVDSPGLAFQIGGEVAGLLTVWGLNSGTPRLDLKNYFIG